MFRQAGHAGPLGDCIERAKKEFPALFVQLHCTDAAARPNPSRALKVGVLENGRISIWRSSSSKDGEHGFNIYLVPDVVLSDQTSMDFVYSALRQST